MVCDMIQAAFSGYSKCSETSEGARITTHCLYPSFDGVDVFVAKVGDGYRVHDGGGAFRSAWAHGRDIPLISRFLNREAARHQLAVVQSAIVADVPDVDWLTSGILAVSNASSFAAHAAVSHFVSAAEDDLIARIYDVLIDVSARGTVHRDIASRGRSGKEYIFNFGITKSTEQIVLINAVSPHPTSISSKYVSFADGGSEASVKLAVHDRHLESGDVALLQQVAEIVPFKALAAGARRAVAAL